MVLGDLPLEPVEQHNDPSLVFGRYVRGRLTDLYALLGQAGRSHACGLCPGGSALTELDCCDSPRGEAEKPAPPVLDPFECLDGMHREFFSFILSIVKDWQVAEHINRF
jgi:hypothetical protein